MHSVDDVDTVGCGVRDLLLHEAPEARQVCSDAGDAHDGALCRGVAPGLVVTGEDAHVAAADKLLVVQAEQGVGRRQELRVENDFDPVRPVVEQLTPPEGVHHRVDRVFRLEEHAL